MRSNFRHSIPLREPFRTALLGAFDWAAHWTPQNLTVTLITGGVRLDWTQPHGTMYGYQIYYSIDGGTTYLPVVTGLLPGTVTYNHYWDGGYSTKYKVRAFFGTEYTDWSNVVTIYVPDTDAINFFIRASLAGVTISAAQRTNIETRIKSLRTANLYNRFDILTFDRIHDKDSAKLNLINQYSTITSADELTGTPAEEFVFYTTHELSNGDILAGAGYMTGHYYRSTDKGANWTDEGALLVGQSGIYYFCDLGNGVVVAGTSTGGRICRSIDYGHNWTDLGNLSGSQYIPKLANLGNGIVIATTEDSPTPATADIHRSTNYGLTWNNVGNGGTDITVINMLCNIGGGIVIAGGGRDTGGGIFDHIRLIRSTNYGATWTNIALPATITASENRFFGSVYLGNGIVLAGTSENGHIIRSIDFGATWTDLGSFYGQKGIISFCDLGNGKVIAGTQIVPANGLILKSDDYGQSWENAGILSANQNINSINKFSDSSILVTTSTDGVLLAKIIRITNYPFIRSTSNTYNQTEVPNGGVLTFTPDSGFSSDSTNSYLDLNFIPSATLKFKLNDCCFGYKVSGTITKPTGYKGNGGQNAAGNIAVSIFCNYTAGTCTPYLNSVASAGGQLDAVGYNCMSRSASGTFKQYVNANSYDITGASLALSDKKLFLLAYNEFPNPNYWSPATAIYELCFAGASITQAEFNTLRTIFDAYIAAL